MQKTSSPTSRFIAAVALALALAIAGQATTMAYEGYGTGSCSIWQKIKSGLSGVWCGYL